MRKSHGITASELIKKLKECSPDKIVHFEFFEANSGRFPGDHDFHTIRLTGYKASGASMILLEGTEL